MSVSEFKIKGMKRWEKVLKKGPFQKELKEQVRRATKLNALSAVKEMRRVIQNGMAPNAELTIAIKKSEKSLVDQGDLFQSITHRMVSDSEAFVGVIRTSESYNVAVIVHEGSTIKVTPAMRGLFFTLWKASESKAGRGAMPELTGRAEELWSRNQNWKPLSPATTAIKIPGRPFVRETFMNAELRAIAEKNWTLAIQQTFKNRSSGA